MTISVLYDFFFQLCFVSVQSVLSCDKIGNAHCAWSKTDWRIAEYQLFLEPLSYYLFFAASLARNHRLTLNQLALRIVLCGGFVCKSFEEIVDIHI